MASVAAGSAGSLVDPPGGGPAAGQKQRKKGKFRLKERSSSSVREKFINDPAYTEDVRHLALPMRRNSGPEHDPGRKFYMISKKKSNSVGKDYSRGSLQLGGGGGGGGASGSSEFYTLDVESIRRAGLNVPEVKPRRKKYNHHSSAELLNRLLNTDESSSSDGVPSKGHSSTLDRGRGRSLDRRSYTTSEERTAVRGLSISRTAGDEDIPLGRDGGRQQQQQQRSRKTRTVSSRRENSDQDVEPVELSAASGLPPGDAYSEDVMVKGATDPREGGSSKGGGRFQIGKRFLKGEIGIKSFNYYLLKEGLKSSKKSLLKQRSAPVVAASATVGSVDIPLPEPPQAMELISPEECEDAPGARMVEKGEENIYEEIYFEDKPKCPPEEYNSKEVSAQRPECPDANSEKIQFIDCELCVQQCSNANCDVCHGLGAQHTAQQHEHHHHQLQQQRQAEQKQQNIYEQLKQHGSGGSSGGSGQSGGGLYGKKAAKSLDVDDQIYQRQKQLLQDQQKQSKQSIDGHARSMGNLVDEPSMYASENVLQYQSYNPSNPNVYKLETTPVAFSSDYSPLQQIYYKQQQQQQQLSAPPSQGDTLPANPRQHIYQRPHQPGGAVSSGSDYYQELNHKKSSSSSDSLQQQQRRLQSNTGIYYQRAAAALSDDQHRSLMSSGAGSKIYKVNSTVSILSEASGRSEGSYHHQQQMAPQIQPQYQPLSVVMKTAPHDHPSTQSGPQARPQQSQQQQQQQQPYGRTGGNMSDSSLGDSLFSYPANRRYFGSSESCRFASESCRRCSVEVDKCSFSDTCRYSDCHNCDCSSSYFSSDFDDTGHGGMRGGKKGSHLTHTQSEAAGYYQAPPYAEDFMKHVSAVKRGNQQQQQQQQQQQPVSTTHLMAGSKIYETPPTYVGMMPITGSGLQKPREPTYETLRNPPYSIPMVGPSYEATPLVASGRLSISQSHEALISPVRRSRSSRSTDTDQYPQLERRSPVSHYSKIRRPHQSSTLPSSMRSARRHQQQGGGEYDPAGYSVIREGPPNTRAATPGPSGGSTLPKSFSLQQARTTPMVSGRSASLLTMGHEYAEITKASARTKPIPPPISTIPSTREARARSKQAATANVRAVSPSQYARTGPSGIAGSSAGNYASMERKSRDRSTKQGKSSDTAGKDRSPVQREQQLEQKGKANRETGPGVAGSAAGGSASLTRSGKPTTGSTRRKEFVRSQQQQHRSKRPVQDDLTDDEDDDEVFLNDKLYERPAQNNRGHSGKDAFAKDSPVALASSHPVTAPQTTQTSSLIASTTSSSIGGGVGTGGSVSTPPTATSTTLTTSPSNGRSSGAQAFDFTLQPPTSSSSSSGTQPHSSSSPTVAATVSPVPAPRAKSKQKPELGAGTAAGSRTAPGGAQPNESESLRTERPKAPVPSAGLSVGVSAGPPADAGPPSSDGSGGLSTTGKVDGKTTTIAAPISFESGVVGEATRRDVVRRPASGPVNRSKDHSPSAADREVLPSEPEQSPNQGPIDVPTEQLHPDNDDDEPNARDADELTKLIGNDECDISDFPLPELPVSSSRQDPTSSDSFLTATDAEDGGIGPADESALAAEQRTRTERTEDTSERAQQDGDDDNDSMHYRTAANGGKPTYLFGENVKKNGIFLNKSGWVQVTGGQQSIPGSRGTPTGSSYQALGSGGSGLATGSTVGQKVTRKYIEYDENRYTGRPGTGASKLEDLINRNESRGKPAGRPSSQQSQQRQDNVTILKIDPGSGTTSSLNAASLSGSRPACLSIKRNLADGSPPPVTPILSPPPAFQDTQQQQQQQQSNKTRLGDIKPCTRIFLSVVDNENHNPKGMVFSRSFEYDRRNRRPPDDDLDQRGGYGGGSGGPGGGSSSSTDAFSKSFEYEFNPSGSMGSLQPQQQPLKSSLIRRNRSPTFATLTGNSPNYLTKKEKPAKLSSPIFPKAIPGNSLTVNRATLGYASSESLRKFDKNKSLDAGVSMGAGAASAGHRSRRSQFSTKANSAPGLPYGFRSDSVGNQRLNSCDSGARSDYSNDDVDDDDDISEDQSSSLALSYKSSTSYINQMKGRAFAGGSPSQSQTALLSAGTPHGLLKSQRSLTPERLYDHNDEYGSARNLKKQRSLTPEKRSRTPDDRTKRKGGSGDQATNSSQSSLVSRQSSGSRSSTLERQQLRYDEGYMRTSSRSSSSSSYSRDENVPTTSPSATYRRNQLRGNVRLQPGPTPLGGGDYKIRRSRSLQLSERSPSRQQMPVQQMPHKVVVRLGTVPPKERPTYATPNVLGGGRKPGPPSQLLSQDSLTLTGSHLYSRISPNSTLDRLRRETASHTLDVVDKSKSFDNNNYGLGLGGGTGISASAATGHPYEYEFDKSKSFDDNLGMPLADRMADKRTYVTTEKRSYSHDRVFGSNSSSNEYATSQSSTSRNRSPQTSLFGGLNRLYEPELPYELNRVTSARSPIMMGSAYRQARAAGVSRERSPVPGYQKPTDLYLMRQQTPDSEYDERLMTPEYGGAEPAQPIATFKEAELVKKFLYATKNKVQMHRESAARNAMPPPTIAGTPSSGSCTASSCDFWPHCGVSSAGATASARQSVEEQSKEQLATSHLPKSGSDNCLSRRGKRVVVAPPEVIYIGDSVGGPRADSGGSNSSSVSSHNQGSHSGGSAIGWPHAASPKAPTGSNGPSAPESAGIGRASGRAVPVPVKANSYGGVSSFGQQHHYYQQQKQQQQPHHQQDLQHPQRILRKQQNFEFYDDDGAGPMSYRMSSGPAAKSTVHGPAAGGLSVEQYGQPTGAGSNSNIISTIIKANSITFLGEHEMPITRDRASTPKGKVAVAGQSVPGSTGAFSTAKSNGGTSMTVVPVAMAPAMVANGKANRTGGSNKQRHHQQSSTVGSNQQQQQHGGTACTGTGTDARDGRARPQTTKPRAAATAAAATAAQPSTSLATGSIKRKFEMKLKSRSLPKSFMRYSNLTTDDLELSAIFTSNAPLQLRAVSSPSISEAPVEVVAPAGRSRQDAESPNHHLSTGGANAHLNPPTTNVHQHPSSTIASSSAPHQKTVQAKVSTAATHHPVQVSESVLQKFRKTFSHFKTSKSAPHPVTAAGVTMPTTTTGLTTSTDLQTAGATMSVDDKQQQQHHHHRFGPLIWRSSKERRKTKSHRRDKCNSGDSGIQVELDNDADQHLLLQQLHPLEHHHPAGVDAGRNGNVPPQYTATGGVPVRRANSAKVSTASSTGSGSSTLLKHKLSLKGKGKENVSNITRLSGKSLSQPSGLDCIVASGGDSADCGAGVDGRRRRRRQHTRTSTTIPTELDLSDSESISSHPDEDDEAVAVEDELLVAAEPVFAEVLFSFRPGGPQELGLEKGALVEVLKREQGPWWWGRLKSDAIVSEGADCSKPSNGGACGWFPKDFVKIVPTYAKPKQIIIISSQGEANKQHHPAGEDDDGASSSASTLIEGGGHCDSTRLMGGLSMAGDATAAPVEGAGQGEEGAGATSHDLTKENIIKELLETEINYVKLLNSLCLGFIKPLREREDVFSVESVNLIFSNLEKIWRFQQTFLDALRVAVPNNRIGEVFLEYQSAFMVYSSYCNSYPRALMELENYANNKEANQILENCRMAENLPELPLSAHLLAPIQRICRYPLHLSELVKHSLTRKELLPTLNLRKCTKSELETMDCREVFELALSAMRRVTEMVNEDDDKDELLF
uniref:serine-rich adhesin for platelets isoform X3 n=1 Tax=Anopheles coluzzii TaxID=1518534 RepID=UPI0020FFC2B8|nr:serine-rich adhesin for platelets isoform X3 [Anopheles coluzzii]